MFLEPLLSILFEFVIQAFHLLFKFDEQTVPLAVDAKVFIIPAKIRTLYCQLVYHRDIALVTQVFGKQQLTHHL